MEILQEEYPSYVHIGESYIEGYMRFIDEKHCIVQCVEEVELKKGQKIIFRIYHPDLGPLFYNGRVIEHRKETIKIDEYEPFIFRQWRQHVRVPFSQAFTIEEIMVSKSWKKIEPIDCVSMNISVGGIYFVTEAELPLIQVKIPIVLMREPLELVVQLVRRETLVGSGIYYGGEFVKLQRDERRVVQRLVLQQQAWL